MSDETQRYLFAFWTLIDEVLNSVQFLLIGLEVLVLSFDRIFIWPAVSVIPLALLARLLAVSIRSWRFARAPNSSGARSPF